MSPRRSLARRGFTIVEMMTAVVIIAVLAAVAYPIYTSRVCRGKQGNGQALLLEARIALEKYHARNETFEAAPPPEGEEEGGSAGSIVTPIDFVKTTLGLSASGETSVNPNRGRYKLVLSDATADNFTLTATSNLDGDATLDEWRCTRRGEAELVTDDCAR